MEAVHPLTAARACFAALAFGLALVGDAAGAGDVKINVPAKLTISGFGMLGNREVTRLLRNFQLDGKMPVVIDRTLVEDAALILLARAHDEGYPRAILTGTFALTNGSSQTVVWTNAMEAMLPREFAAHEARFRLTGGVRFHYDSIEFNGVTAFSKSAAESYFLRGDMLLRLPGNRVFTPVALRRSLAAFREAYARAGYRDAVVDTNRVTWTEASGAVQVEVEVEEGLPSIVRSVTIHVEDGDPAAKEPRLLTPGKPFTGIWQQALAQQLAAEQQKKGYPDAKVDIAILRRATNSARIEVDLKASVTRGPFVRVGKVVTTGNRRTKDSVVRSQIKLVEGGPLNRVEAEKSRQRLARLGVFDSVHLRYQAAEPNARDVIFGLEEGKAISLSVLGGFGSYELLRGGLEFEYRNLWGRAHDLRLHGSQSFKSSHGDLLYTVPALFGQDANLFLQGEGLRREEVSFLRREYGGSVGVQKRLIPLETDFTVRYDYEFLHALELEGTSTNRLGAGEAKSAAFEIELTRDRRDHPLLPRRGLKLFTKLELASASLGGNVDYQRFIFGASHHLDLGSGRLLHVGVTHGDSFTWGGTDSQLPFNKRFFPGGENSVRGYREGEASPLDGNGDQLGAETFTQANLEFEQLFTRSWSAVIFFDAVGFAENRSDFPWNEVLMSVGGGVRWRSFIGPARLEYGHNLNRRRHDPAGTLHFSVGFPF